MASLVHTAVCDLLGIEYPIVQTAMGWVATPELVAGTCNAGGMGFLAAAVSTPEQADRDIRRVKELTDRPFGVNFLMEQPGAERIVELIVSHGVRAASYSRSPNPAFIERFKKAGILCVPTVGAVRHAVKAVQLGADVIIAQGGEGGGHTGSVPTSLLVPGVVDAVDVPVLAAGGFRDGRGLAAALAFGAAGIAMGTRFLLTAESPLPAETAKRYFAAGVTDVLITTRVDGLPQRVIQNELVSELERASRPALLLRALATAWAYRKMTGATVRDLISAALSMRRNEKLTRSQILMAANAPMLIQKAMVEGRPSDGVLPSGQVAGLIEDRPSCGELIAGIVTEAENRLAELGGANAPEQRAEGK